MCAMGKDLKAQAMWAVPSPPRRRLESLKGVPSGFFEYFDHSPHMPRNHTTPCVLTIPLKCAFSYLLHRERRKLAADGSPLSTQHVFVLLFVKCA